MNTQQMRDVRALPHDNKLSDELRLRIKKACYHVHTFGLDCWAGDDNLHNMGDFQNKMIREESNGK